MNDIETRTHDLEAFANAGGQSNQPPQGHALTRTTHGLAGAAGGSGEVGFPVGAQPVAVYRDEQRIMQKLTQLAAFAGSDWFYRFPVKTKDGGRDWIEGPSIKLANNVARIYGNNINQIREFDVGDAWIFYARFTDIETGFSMERAYRQRKGQASLKTKDADRQLDIAYQIGQSKAIRNCIVNSLEVFCDFAFEEARNSIVQKIGKDLAGWRERTLQGLKNMPVDVQRVERVVGRASKDWVAPNIAQIIAMMKSVADGMATIDEVFPPIESESAAVDAPPMPNPAAGPEGGGAQSADSNPAVDAGSAARTVDSGADSAATTAKDPVTVAYERGREAKAKNQLRMSMPVEYRDTSRKPECDAWLAGFDGKPMPML